MSLRYRTIYLVYSDTIIIQNKLNVQVIIISVCCLHNNCCLHLFVSKRQCLELLSGGSDIFLIFYSYFVLFYFRMSEFPCYSFCYLSSIPDGYHFGSVPILNILFELFQLDGEFVSERDRQRERE